MNNHKRIIPIIGVGLGVIAIVIIVAFSITWIKERQGTPKHDALFYLTNTPPHPEFKQIKVNKPASQLTAAEKQTLAELFTERFKPAIEHWANAYKGHIPFDVSDINVTNFYSVTAGNYTFMMGSTTFVIFNSVYGAKVFYMMTKQGARDLNSVPTDGQPRNLSVPITREEVLKMAEADTGLHYELKDIVINPTAKFSNIDGGADVEVGIKYNAAGMMLITPDNLGFVLDSNGMLVTYQH